MAKASNQQQQHHRQRCQQKWRQQQQHHHHHRKPAPEETPATPRMPTVVGSDSQQLQRKQHVTGPPDMHRTAVVKSEKDLDADMVPVPDLVGPMGRGGRSDSPPSPTPDDVGPEEVSAARSAASSSASRASRACCASSADVTLSRRWGPPWWVTAVTCTGPSVSAGRGGGPKG